MSLSRPPLRVAFWAIAAALVLMLLLTISDPYQARQSILARSTTGPSDGGEARVLIAHSISPRASDKHVATADVPEGVSPPGNRTELSSDETQFSETQSDPLVPLPPGPPKYALTTTVSAVIDGTVTDETGPAEPSPRSAMPILNPGNRNDLERQREFVELPPPPGMAALAEGDIPAPEEAIASEQTPRSHEGAQQAIESSPQLDWLRLESEILTLRHDLTLLAEDRRLTKWDDVQRRQEELSDRQQQTADRLDRLAEQISTHTARLEALLEQSQSMNNVATPDTAASQASAEPQFAQSADGRERFSLIIESDDVSAVLERLGRWSQESTAAPAVTAVHLQPTPDPAPQHIAPPERRTTSTVAAPQSGPTFAPSQPPCNCR